MILENTNQNIVFIKDSQKTMKVLAEYLVDIILDAEIRICDTCKSIMTEGYIYEEAGEYHCSDECLEEDRVKCGLSHDDIQGYFENDTLFWTDWPADKDILTQVNALLESHPQLKQYL